MAGVGTFLEEQKLIRQQCRKVATKVPLKGGVGGVRGGESPDGGNPPGAVDALARAYLLFSTGEKIIQPRKRRQSDIGISLP